MGSTAGVGLESTVVQQILRDQLHAKLDLEEDTDKIIRRLRQSLVYIKDLEPHTKNIVICCYVNATTCAFSLAFMFSFGALVC